jgi:hypothetical protein
MSHVVCVVRYGNRFDSTNLYTLRQNGIMASPRPNRTGWLMITVEVGNVIRLKALKRSVNYT